MKKKRKVKIFLNLNGNKIVCEDNVKLLGVIIDSDLNFDNHISEMCKKASRQLNILKRIGKYMNSLTYSMHNIFNLRDTEAVICIILLH